jgi:hypothetical protein
MGANQEDIEKLLFIMANLPEFLRLSFARRKVSELISMIESDRILTINSAIKCLSTLESNMITRLITSWIRAMCEIEPSMLIELMESYHAALLNDKDFVNTNPEKLSNAYYSLTEENQERIMMGLKEALLLSPDPIKLVNMLPQRLKIIMGYEN